MDHHGVRALLADQEAWPRLHGGGTLAHPEETWRVKTNRREPGPFDALEEPTLNAALAIFDLMQPQSELEARAVAARKELLKMASDPDPIDKHVGNRIRLRRLDIGCSQTKLAKAVGVTFQQVQKYEKGTNRIAASRLYKLAKILGVPITFFFDGLESPKHRNSPHR